MQFQINQRLRNRLSGEEGVCKGRAEYAPEERQPSYFVRFKDAQGRAATEWWVESMCEAADVDAGAAQ